MASLYYNDQYDFSTIELNIVDNATKDTFLSSVYPKRMPVILKDIDIGPCKEKWTVDYLAEKGGDKDVKIHVSEHSQMDFINKNFVYRTQKFSKFVKQANESKHDDFFISETEKYYLRALGDDPRKDVANIEVQFPELAKDVDIPDFFDKSKFFSSVFRIASPGMQLWTHYDVMDNLLMQITGKKRVVLFSPQEANNLYLNGDKSEVLDIDDPDMDKYPRFENAIRYESILEPGDVLFIPALWFHNVISLDFGVAVNVFWKHLSEDKYDPKDTYGNKDPLPAARATQIVDHALKVLDELPSDYKDFYSRMLVTRIKNKGYGDVDQT